MVTLNKLFTPGRIGRLEIKNRIIMSPMGTYSYGADGVPPPQTVNYFEERARGGVGLIICHGVRVSPEARVVGLASLFEDAQIPLLAKVSAAIHRGGAYAALQVAHSGRFQTVANASSDIPPDTVAPSRLTYVKTGTSGREATREDIHRLIEHFSEGARRVKEAGFDMVEVHAAHGYLLSSFLSPFTNRRTDEYGGSPQKRARLICEIIQRVREKVGPDFPISVRFSGSDFLSGGTTIEDSLVQAPLFEQAGANLLNVTGGALENCETRYLSYLWPDAYLSDLAAQIKRVVKVPVCTVGKLVDPVVANRVLEQGKADFIALGKPLLADPNWARKAKEGKLDEINRCIYCLNCVDRMLTVSREQRRLFCTVNPSLFREQEYAIHKVAKAKKVIVIGGGIAGMQAARVAAERGHSVTLYEAGGELGGAWNIASAQPHKEGYRNLTRLLSKGLSDAGARVILNRKVDARLVTEEKPDCVIMATGARPLTPAIPGAGGPNVVQAVDVITGKARTGNRVVVIGGRMIGMETATYLAEQGKKVSLITLKRLGENGKKLEDTVYRTIRNQMVKLGIQIFPYTPAVEIRPDGVYADDGGNLLWLAADTVVLAVGYKPERSLLDELKGAVPEIRSIGDCNSPRDGLEATREGMEAGLAV